MLGTIISEDLDQVLNTNNLVKKAKARMELVRKVASLGASADDLKSIYILFVLEQSATVWYTSLREV